MIVKIVCLECNIPQRTETAVCCGGPRSVWPDLYPVTGDIMHSCIRYYTPQTLSTKILYIIANLQVSIHNHIISKGKGKAVPLQAWSGPEGSRKLRFPDFMTTAQDGGKVVSLTHRPPLPPGNTPGTHFC